jgi:hypothetical protein
MQLECVYSCIIEIYFGKQMSEREIKIHHSKRNFEILLWARVLKADQKTGSNANKISTNLHGHYKTRSSMKYRHPINTKYSK